MHLLRLVHIERNTTLTSIRLELLLCVRFGNTLLGITVEWEFFGSGQRVSECDPQCYFFNLTRAFPLSLQKTENVFFFYVDFCSPSGC